MGAASLSALDMSMSGNASAGVGMRPNSKWQTQTEASQCNTIDLHSFLLEHHQYVVSSTIEDCRALTQRKFRMKYQESMDEEWDCEREQIMQLFGGGEQGDQGIDMNLSLLNYPQLVENQQQQAQLQLSMMQN